MMVTGYIPLFIEGSDFLGKTRNKTSTGKSRQRRIFIIERHLIFCIWNWNLFNYYMVGSITNFLRAFLRERGVFDYAHASL